MATEYEIKFLDIDYISFVELLKEAGAIFKQTKLQKITIFYGLNDDDREYIRVRDEGDKITLTHKRTYENSMKADEAEVIVNSYEETVLLLEKIGLSRKRTEEKARTTFLLNTAIIDIDTWPDVPTYAEIEAETEDSIVFLCNKIGLNIEDGFKGDAHDVFRHYGIDPIENNHMVFSETSLNKPNFEE